MIRKVMFPDDFYKHEIMFFREADLNVLPNIQVVPLFGPNGSGKTTMLQAISTTTSIIGIKLEDETDLASIIHRDNKEWLEKCRERKLKENGCVLQYDDVPHRVYGYANSTDNFRNRKARTVNESFDPAYISARFDAQSVSEGQSIVYSIFDLFDILKPGDEMEKVENGHLIVLLDELDSGLSIDNIDMFMRKIKHIIKLRDDIQFIFSFNNPRVLKFFPHVLSMYDGKVYEMHTDEDMLCEMNRNKKMFDKARRKSNGRPKVYT